MRVALLIGLLATFAGPVLAQDTARGGVLEERQTLIIIEPDLIEGGVPMPGGVIVTPPPKAPRHRSLIRIRSDFRREVLSSVAQL